MMGLVRLSTAIFLSLALVLPVFAGSVPISHSPIPLNRAQLVVAGPNGEATYSAADLEELGFRRLTTVTPWRDTPAAFDGILLTDLLAANGLSDAAAIEVTAENDYKVIIPASAWKKWPILIATRVNGQAHSRRLRGPIQFILPMSEYAVAGQSENRSYWVWMAARIDAVE